MSELIPVLLSGGSGTRLWPLPHGTRPKTCERAPPATGLAARVIRDVIPCRVR